MKRFCLVLILIAAVAAAQRTGRPRQEEDRRQVRLPNGKMQRDEILKADYEKTLKEAAELSKLAGELKIELEKNERHVLSLVAVKKTEEIEKLARRIRERMKRF